MGEDSQPLTVADQFVEWSGRNVILKGGGGVK